MIKKLILLFVCCCTNAMQQGKLTGQSIAHFLKDKPNGLKRLQALGTMKCHCAVFEKAYKTSLLHAATLQDNLQVIFELLKNEKRDPNQTDAKGRTPLFYAKSKEAVEYLCAYGADFLHTDNYEQTALHVIAKGFARTGPPVSLETITAIIARGADMYAQDRRGRTPKNTAEYVRNYFLEKNTEKAKTIVGRQNSIITLFGQEERRALVP